MEIRFRFPKVTLLEVPEVSMFFFLIIITKSGCNGQEKKRDCSSTTMGDVISKSCNGCYESLDCCTMQW